MFNLGDAKPSNTPMIPGISYTKEDAPADKTEAAHMAKVPLPKRLLVASVHVSGNVP